MRLSYGVDGPFILGYLLTLFNSLRDGSLHIHVSEKSSGKSVGVIVEHG